MKKDFNLVRNKVYNTPFYYFFYPLFLVWFLFGCNKISRSNHAAPLPGYGNKDDIQTDDYFLVNIELPNPYLQYASFNDKASDVHSSNFLPNASKNINPEYPLLALSTFTNAAIDYLNGQMVNEPEPQECLGEHQSRTCDWKTCGKAFTYKDHFINHIRIKHLSASENRICEWLHCKSNRKRFSSKRTFENHVRSHIEERSFKREQYGKTFTHKSGLTSHLITHTDESLYRCKPCKKDFKYKNGLTRHLIKYEQCNQAFKHKSDLTSHRKTHTDESLFKCEQCSKTFTHKSGLTSHLITHTDESLYRCKPCKKDFKYKNGLTRHLIKYEQCNQAFKHKSDLTSHRKTHTNERLFKCEHCNKTLTSERFLKNHIASKHTGHVIESVPSNK